MRPEQLLRLVRAKQRRSEKLLDIARRFAVLTGQRRERVVMYESLQARHTSRRDLA